MLQHLHVLPLSDVVKLLNYFPNMLQHLHVLPLSDVVKLLNYFPNMLQHPHVLPLSDVVKLLNYFSNMLQHLHVLQLGDVVNFVPEIRLHFLVFLIRQRPQARAGDCTSKDEKIADFFFHKFDFSLKNHAPITIFASIVIRYEPKIRHD
jgi:hypothetical protein